MPGELHVVDDQDPLHFEVVALVHVVQLVGVNFVLGPSLFGLLFLHLVPQSLKVVDQLDLGVASVGQVFYLYGEVRCAFQPLVDQPVFLPP